jgi:hypothetical protein
LSQAEVLLDGALFGFRTKLRDHLPDRELVVRAVGLRIIDACSSSRMDLLVYHDFFYTLAFK